MKTWILILTLYAGEFAHTSTTVESIPGFATQQECLAAGNAWLKQSERKLRFSNGHPLQSYVGRALCVSQTTKTSK